LIGYLIVSHYQLAEEFLRALELIQGKLEHFRAIGLDPAARPEQMRGRIEKALREVDQGDGAVILVDMFGGTPSNLCLAFLEEGRVEVVTGLNLPMLVKVAGLKDGLSVHEAAETAREYGRRNISVASDILTGADPSEDDT
jgi:PTS system mannose-specific IIA component